MNTDNTDFDDKPKISLRQISVRSGAEKSSWSIAWRVENLSRHSLRLDAARFPHGQFKAGEQSFEPPLIIAEKENAQFESTIACAASVGEVIENAFVIFSALWRDRAWRIFVRLRVVMDGHAEPNAVTELITTQQVGFSGELRSER